MKSRGGEIEKTVRGVAEGLTKGVGSPALEQRPSPAKAMRFERE